MKNKIKIYLIAATIVLAVSLIVFGCSVFAASPGRITWLIAGFDDAAENTDVLCIVDLDFATGLINVLQIPRDTYFNFGDSQNKINQFFPAIRSKGLTRHSAMHALCDTLEKNLAVSIDGYIGITTQTFTDAVSYLGGLFVESEGDIELLSDGGKPLLSLEKGENHLSPQQALILARYRSGYARGDLERLDAQKLLITGFYKTVVKAGGYGVLANMLLSLDGVVSDISLSQIVPLIGRMPSISDMTVSVNRLPGEAVQDAGGLWYYVINKRGSVDLLRLCAAFDEENFDPDRVFLKKENKKFSDIYYS